MRPWEHYIPIKNDYSDLKEKYIWAETNLNKASKIAWEGYKVAHKYIKDVPEYFMQAVMNKCF